MIAYFGIAALLSFVLGHLTGSYNHPYPWDNKRLSLVTAVCALTFITTGTTFAILLLLKFFG